MIGQINLQSDINNLITNNSFPRFTILTGLKGSGKKLMVSKISEMLSITLVILPDVKIDTVRQVITEAYKQSNKTLYFIPDADNMSTPAKNALLKVIEEPPNRAYFIMSLEDINNTLPTIKSRGTVFQMDRYTPDEIFEYYWTVGDMPNGAEIVRTLCETPGEVKKCVDMCSGTVMSFYDYVNLVADNIAKVSGANAFKIADKVALKDESEGYDLKLFWKAFCKVCADRIAEDVKYAEAISITSEHIQCLRIKGISKQALMDMWILAIRKAWM